MKLTKNQTIFLYLGAGLSLLVLMERFFISEFRDRLYKFEQQIRLEEARLRKDLNIQRTKDIILKDYEYCKPFLRLNDADEKDIVADLLKEIENLVRISGASVVNLSHHEAKEETPRYRKYRATLRLEATLQQLLNFLHSVQNSELLMKLDKISIVSKDEEAHVLSIDGIITIAIPL